MKRPMNYAFCLLALLALSACGKDNKSGKNSYDFASPYSAGGMNPYTGQAPAFGQYAVAQVINENPCVGGVYGQISQRLQVNIPLNNFPTVISPGDVYVGVTSYGDVAALVGTGAAPNFVAFICPRSAASGQGMLNGISLGAYSNCAFKPMAAATMRFPDGTSANFRMMDYGSSASQKFSYCR